MTRRRWAASLAARFCSLDLRFAAAEEAPYKQSLQRHNARSTVVNIAVGFGVSVAELCIGIFAGEDRLLLCPGVAAICWGIMAVCVLARICRPCTGFCQWWSWEYCSQLASICVIISSQAAHAWLPLPDVGRRELVFGIVLGGASTNKGLRSCTSWALSLTVMLVGAADLFATSVRQDGMVANIRPAILILVLGALSFRAFWLHDHLQRSRWTSAHSDAMATPQRNEWISEHAVLEVVPSASLSSWDEEKANAGLTGRGSDAGFTQVQSAQSPTGRPEAERPFGKQPFGPHRAGPAQPFSPDFDDKADLDDVLDNDVFTGDAESPIDSDLLSRRDQAPVPVEVLSGESRSLCYSSSARDPPTEPMKPEYPMQGHERFCAIAKCEQEQIGLLAARNASAITCAAVLKACDIALAEAQQIANYRVGQERKRGQNRLKEEFVKQQIAAAGGARDIALADSPMRATQHRSGTSRGSSTAASFYEFAEENEMFMASRRDDSFVKSLGQPGLLPLLCDLWILDFAACDERLWPGPPATWLHRLDIIGEYVIDGEENLSPLERDGDELYLKGGLLILNGDVLFRVGKSGRALPYRRATRLAGSR